MLFELNKDNRTQEITIPEEGSIIGEEDAHNTSLNQNELKESEENDSKNL